MYPVAFVVGNTLWLLHHCGFKHAQSVPAFHLCCSMSVDRLQADVRKLNRHHVSAVISACSDTTIFTLMYTNVQKQLFISAVT